MNERETRRDLEIATRSMLRGSYEANGGDLKVFDEWDALREKSQQVAFMWENGLVDRIPRKYLRHDHMERILEAIGLRKREPACDGSGFHPGA